MTYGEQIERLALKLAMVQCACFLTDAPAPPDMGSPLDWSWHGPDGERE